MPTFPGETLGHAVERSKGTREPTMAMIDRPDTSMRNERKQETTKHPGVCLLGFFAVLCGSALAVHLIMSALF